MSDSEVESDSSFFVSDDEANDSADGKVRRDTTAAAKRFANEVSCNLNPPLRQTNYIEQPFWLDDAGKGPGPSSLIIRGEVIEISDDEAPVTSPTKLLATASVHHSNVAVKNEVRRFHHHIITILIC